MPSPFQKRSDRRHPSSVTPRGHSSRKAWWALPSLCLRIDQPPGEEEAACPVVADDEEERVVGAEYRPRLGCAEGCGHEHRRGGRGSLGPFLVHVDVCLVDHGREGEWLARRDAREVGLAGGERERHAQVGQRVLELKLRGDLEPRECDVHPVSYT